MKSFVIKILSLFLLFISCSNRLFAQRALEGDWAGHLDTPIGKLKILLHLQQTDTLLLGSMDVPQQNAFNIPLTKVFLRGEDFFFSLKPLAIEFKGKLEGSSIVGHFSQGTMKNLPLCFKKQSISAAEIAAAIELVTPLPYEKKKLKIPALQGEGHQLVGTLYVPKSHSKRRSAMVLVHGSGPNNRDELVFSHGIFKTLADRLARKGIVVLAYDKRGVGESTGDFSTAEIKDFASDAAAALDCLRQQDAVDSTRVGLLGHSEGGYVAQYLSQISPCPYDFLVFFASPGLRGKQILQQQIRDSFSSLSLSSPQTKEEVIVLLNRSLNIASKPEKNREDSLQIKTIAEEIYRQKLANDIGFSSSYPSEEFLRSSVDHMVKANVKMYLNPWFSSFLRFNPQDYLKHIQVPVLIMHGAKDMQVKLTPNIDALKKGLSRLGEGRLKIIVYPELNHLFLPAKTGSVSEYAEIEEDIPTDLTDDLASWVLSL